MVENITGYDIHVKAKSLEDVTKIITFLKEAGFSDLSLYTSHPDEVNDEERREREKVRYSNFILLALQSAKANSEESAIDVEQIIKMGRLHLTPRMVYVLLDKEGIAKRTINMIATSIMADKYGYVAYTNTEPKKFWLTAKGVEKVPTSVV